MMQSLPRIGITMGDPAGIGPEIVVSALSDPEINEVCRPLVIGSRALLEKACKVRGVDLGLNPVSDMKDVRNEYGVLNYIECGLPAAEIEVGKVSKEVGEASLAYIKKVTGMLLNNDIDATASAPVNKEALRMAGSKQTGATEIFASLTGTKEVTTVIKQGPAYVFQITTHVPLKKALEMITYDKLYRAVTIADSTLANWGIECPRLAIAGFNPHAGENGVLGDEENVIFEPCISKLKKEGINISGPIPADSIFEKGLCGEYDGILFLYHDQANIPIKLMADRHTPVVISAGLPFVRTTVAHGTAYDIAYKNLANPRPMREAIIASAKISERIRCKGFDSKI